MRARIAFILLLGWLAAVGTPDTLRAASAALPPNAWVKIEKDDARFANTFKRLELTYGGDRAQHANWLFRAKWWNFSSSGDGVWLPEQKKVFFLNGKYGDTWLYDSAAFGSWKEPLVRKKPLRGWTKLKPGGGKLPPTLRWASACYDPLNKEVLLVGGNCNRVEGRGSPGTMVYSVAKNEWRRLDFSKEPLFKAHAECEALRRAAHALAGRLRARWQLSESAGEKKVDLASQARALAGKITAFSGGLPKGKAAAAWVRPELDAAAAALKTIGGAVSPQVIAKAGEAAERLREARDWLAVEPPPRANAALAYDAQSKKIVLHGGDHFDYLMSDTWAYDCAKRRWEQRRPPVAPAPRAGHALVALPGTGQVALLGGYAYGSEEGYSAADYMLRPFELWTYDVASNKWALLGHWPRKKGRVREGSAMEGAPASPRSGRLRAAAGPDGTIVCFSQERMHEGKRGWWGVAPYACRVDLSKADAAGTKKHGVPAGTIGRRTGKYLPTWWDQTEKPEAAAREAFLKSLPPNTWTPLKPPKVLNRNRDWGTAVFDTDRGQILYFSGGHCAYSGTDVSMYSTRANRWRISALAEMPIQFCRGTGYHAQAWSFTGRPWMNSHTYKMYGYDPLAKKMVFSGRRHTFLFDPCSGDWENPPKPSPFGVGFNPKYAASPEGLYVWANPVRRGKLRSSPKSTGSIYHFNAQKMDWDAVKTNAPVPGVPFADSGTLVHDTKRKRLLLFAQNRKRKDVSVWSCNPTSGAFEKIAVKNIKAGPGFPRESVYLPKGDLVLFADKRKDIAPGRVVVIIYDVAGKRFRGLELGAPKPVRHRKGSGYVGGMNVGLMYDPRRGLVWKVDAGWNVRVLRFDPRSARFVDTP